MSSNVAKTILVYGVVMLLVGLLALVSQIVDLSLWVWAGCLAVVGMGSLGLFLTERSAGLLLLAAYVLWVVAGLIVLVPTELLRDEAIAIYLQCAIAVAFVGVFVRNRARWWALVPAYALLAVAGIISLAEIMEASDKLISAYIVLTIALPFLVIYARNRRRWWALIPGGVLTLIGLSFGTWLPWPTVRSTLVIGEAGEYLAALALLVLGAWILARAVARRAPAG